MSDRCHSHNAKIPCGKCGTEDFADAMAVVATLRAQLAASEAERNRLDAEVCAARYALDCEDGETLATGIRDWLAMQAQGEIDLMDARLDANTTRVQLAAATERAEKAEADLERARHVLEEAGVTGATVEALAASLVDDANAEARKHAASQLRADERIRKARAGRVAAEARAAAETRRADEAEAGADEGLRLRQALNLRLHLFYDRFAKACEKYRRARAGDRELGEAIGEVLRVYDEMDEDDGTQEARAILAERDDLRERLAALTTICREYAAADVDYCEPADADQYMAICQRRDAAKAAFRRAVEGL